MDGREEKTRINQRNKGDCNQTVVFLFTLNYPNVRNNEYDSKFFRQIFKLEGLRGQRAAIVVRLYYEDGIKAGREMQGARTDLTFLPNGKKVNTYKMLAKKAGVGQGSIGRLIPVYRNRPDLFELVFDGTYTINKAYTHARARCNVLLDIMSTRNLLIRTRTRGYALGKVKKDKMSLSDSSYTHAR